MNNSQSSIAQIAHKYLKQGFSLIPCRKDKRPAGQWRQYTINPPKVQEIHRWFDELNYQSMGLIMGKVSQNIVAIDLDGIPAIRQFASEFPQICENTKSVLTGSQAGVHLYLRVKNLPENTNVRVKNVGGFEIRGNGQYIIAPPSLHPSGNLYRVYRDKAILEVNNLTAVREWMLSLKESENPLQQSETKASARPVSVRTKTNKRAYLETVVSQELARVRMSGEGNRNQSLFYASLRLANLAAGGELSWLDMHSKLFQVSQETRPAMKRVEAERTIASAWRIGSQRPRRVS